VYPGAVSHPDAAQQGGLTRAWLLTAASSWLTLVNEDIMDMQQQPTDVQSCFYSAFNLSSMIINTHL